MPFPRRPRPEPSDRFAPRPSLLQTQMELRRLGAELGSRVTSRYKFLDFPAELRVIIYEFLFSELSQRERPPFIVYHLCTKAYEVTSRFQRLLGHPSIPVFTGILRTCRKVHDEALPKLYDHATLIADLRPAGNKLEFGPGVCRQLGLVKSLEINISMAFPCRFAPKVVTSTGLKKRRASWNGSSSIGANNSVTGPLSPPVRARANSWADPTPEKMCFVQYLRRLEALLQSFDNGANLRRLDIAIDNKDASLDPQKVNSILGLMASRLRLRPGCTTTLHLDSRVMNQLGSQSALRVSGFLDQIEPRASHQPNVNHPRFSYHLSVLVPGPNSPYPFQWATQFLFPGEDLLFRSGLYPFSGFKVVYPHGGVLMDMHQELNVPRGQRYRYELKPERDL